MWKIDSDGNAYNPDTGERMFVAISVLLQERGCGGHRQWLGACKSEEDASDFIKKFVAQLNAEGTENVED